jgi:hypothetical protein
MRAYGRYIGNRYKNSPNIVWVIGGDTDPVAAGVADKVREFVAGLREYDSVHLITAHNNRDQSAMDVWPGESWLGLNNIYTGGITYTDALQEYGRVPFKPFFLMEALYENEHGTTPQSLRAQAYGAVLSGAHLGHFFGNCPIWNFGVSAGFCASTDWEGQLSSAGSQSLAHVGRLLGSRAHYRLVPDQNHSVLVSGYQSGASYASTARTDDGASVISYIPTARTVTIEMSRVTGTTARGWWYDPRTGAATLIGDMPTTGTRAFTSPTSEDWILVLDDQARNLPPPGNDGW